MNIMKTFKFQCPQIKCYWSTAMAIHSRIVYGGFLVTVAGPSSCDRDLVAHRLKIGTGWPITENLGDASPEDMSCCGLHERSGRKQRFVEHRAGRAASRGPNVCISFCFPLEVRKPYSCCSSSPISVWDGGEAGKEMEAGPKCWGRGRLPGVAGAPH